jgi:hypothetical protein
MSNLGDENDPLPSLYKISLSENLVGGFLV